MFSKNICGPACRLLLSFQLLCSLRLQLSSSSSAFGCLGCLLQQRVPRLEHSRRLKTSEIGLGVFPLSFSFRLKRDWNGDSKALVVAKRLGTDQCRIRQSVSQWFFGCGTFIPYSLTLLHSYQDLGLCVSSLEQSFRLFCFVFFVVFVVLIRYFQVVLIVQMHIRVCQDQGN